MVQYSSDKVWLGFNPLFKQYVFFNPVPNINFADPPTIKEASSSTDKSWISQTVTFKCVSDGVPTPTLIWYKPDGSQRNSVKASQNIVDVQMKLDQDFGGYKCVTDNGLAPADFKIVEIKEISAFFFVVVVLK